MGGSYARTNVPSAQSFSYNPDNSLQKLGTFTVPNDNNGNITCMVSSPCPQFSYDARGISSRREQVWPRSISATTRWGAGTS